MKALLSVLSLLLLVIPVSAEVNNDDPFADNHRPPAPKVIKELNVDKVPLKNVFDYVARTLPEASNVVYKNGAENIPVSLNLRNVTLENLLQVLEALTEVRVKMLDSNKKDSSPGIIFVEASQIKPPVVPVAPATPVTKDPFSENHPSGRTRTVISSTPSKTNHFGLGPNHPSHPNNLPPITRAYHLNNLKADEVIDAIKAMWKSAAPGWKDKNEAFSFHAPSSLLLIKAPEVRQKEAENILEMILSNSTSSKQEEEVRYQKKLQEERMKLLEEKMEMRIDAAVRQQEQHLLRAEELMKELQVRELELAKLRATIQELEKRLQDN